MKTVAYSDNFYDEMKVTNLTSARKVVPLVMDFIKPQSVCDIGCGVGLWLKAFMEHGVKEIKGFDGDWVKSEMLVIPPSSFSAVDISQPLKIDRKYDLTVCLEVAEHLNSNHAEGLINNLTQTSTVILFSAAIPFQGGSHHVNEQWPEYWADLMARAGYVSIDCLRMLIWNNPEVSFFYKQNIFLFVKKDELHNYPKLNNWYHNNPKGVVALVHPHMYLYYANRWRLLVPWLGKISPSFLHGIKRILEFFKK